MKKINFLFYAWIMFLVSCSQQQKDKDIKETIAARAKQEIAFAGVNFIVTNGSVTLTGNCPSAKDRSKVESAVKQTAGVKNVNNQIVIAPVTLNADFPLKQAVDSVLQKYPTVTGNVQDSAIVVQGNVGSKEVEKLFSSLQSLHAKGLTNELTVTKE